MRCATPPSPLQTEHDYRRRARRIRAIWRGNPFQAQRALVRLAAEQSQRHPRWDWSRSAILGHRTAAARDFADLVACRLVGGALPWSSRQFLLRQAARRRIGRFEANLIIAAVQHHLPAAPPAAPRPVQPRRRLFVPMALIALLAAEAALLSGVWHHLFS